MEEDKPEEFVDFSAKYKEWVAVKRLRITPQTKPEEIAYHLSPISQNSESIRPPFTASSPRRAMYMPWQWPSAIWRASLPCKRGWFSKRIMQA